MSKHTSFSKVYDMFLSSVTDDMYMELTELDTFRILEDLLISAISWFEFPRINLLDYEIRELQDQSIYNGVESNYTDALAFKYNEGRFNNVLSLEEIKILSMYMIVEWIGQQLASVENTRMKYSGSDFKFTSQANHLQKLITLKKEYERKGFHLQRLYKRRKVDSNGIMQSTMHTIMEPYTTTSASNININSIIENCEENTEEVKAYVSKALSWNEIPGGESYVN